MNERQQPARPLGRSARLCMGVQALLLAAKAGVHLHPGHLNRRRCGTIVAMSTASLRSVKYRISEFVERLDRHHERVVVTRNGWPAAVLVSPADLASLEETLDVLSDAAAMADLAQADEALAAGDTVAGVEAVRALRRRG